MPVIEVLNLPMLVPEETRRLRNEIIKTVTSIGIPGLENKEDLIILFPLCIEQYEESGLVKLVKIWGFEEILSLSSSRIQCLKFAEKALQVVTNFFPDDNVRCYVNRHQDGQAGYWITKK